ncbi:hypothetical protein LSAT2_029952 [Lamellibrachia satsuma]|nr:hypothetical protein LSAT2_029952 [Lamellibrachia satsuma]
MARASSTYNYKSLDAPDSDLVTEEIGDWHQRELVVRNVGTYKEFLVSAESTHVMNLWPFSRITARVLILNGAKRGDLGDTIEFTTPEGGPCAAHISWMDMVP